MRNKFIFLTRAVCLPHASNSCLTFIHYPVKLLINLGFLFKQKKLEKWKGFDCYPSIKRRALETADPLPGSRPLTIVTTVAPDAGQLGEGCSAMQWCLWCSSEPWGKGALLCSGVWGVLLNLNLVSG